MARAHSEPLRVCPFIDLDDPRCDVRFSLSRLDQAFHVCVNGGYARCPTHRLLAGHAPRRGPGYEPDHTFPARGTPRDATIRLTLHGRSVARADGGSELRPTGS